MIVKFGHYHDSMETCHDSDSIRIVLNIIRSGVGRFCIHKCTIGAPCYIKELPNHQSHWLQVHVSLSIRVSWYYNLKIKVSVCFQPPKLPVNTSYYYYHDSNATEMCNSIGKDKRGKIETILMQAALTMKYLAEAY